MPMDKHMGIEIVNCRLLNGLMRVLQVSDLESWVATGPL